MCKDSKVFTNLQVFSEKRIKPPLYSPLESLFAIFVQVPHLLLALMQWFYLKEESLSDDSCFPSIEALSGHRLLLRCVTIIEQLSHRVISEPSGSAVSAGCDDGAAIAESNLSVPFSHIYQKR